MAVSEVAVGKGKAASGERRGRNVALAMFAFALSPLAWPQIVVDPNAAGNLKPQIVTTANGVTQVNIQTPSAAGVSRNVYSQFDVNAQGAILNNATGNVQTQLGGWVQGNGNLAGGSARVILNEVNSSSPSQLRGYVEVAGQRAEVIIANPAGIAVNGGGFINASGVTLTTGTPQLNGGNLEGYRVQRGTVIVDGAGLDTKAADYTNIIARAVQVNAGIWAKDLKVTTGANDVNAANTSATAIAGTGSAPTVALDVSALGGMYAGKITMVGTEAGVGVNNSGTIAASSGALVLDASGVLTNRGVLDGNSTTVKADTINNTGTGRIYGDQVSLQAQTLNNAPETVSGTTTAPVIAARSRMDIGVQTLNNSDQALILSAGDMAIGGQLDANGHATGTANAVRNGSAIIEAIGNMTVSANTLTNANDHFAFSGDQLVSTQTDISEVLSSTYNRTYTRYTYAPVVSQDEPGKLLSGGNMTLNATQIVNQQSKIVAGGTLTTNSATIDNQEVTSQERVRDVGTQWSWGVVGGHSEGPWYDRHWVYDWGMVASGYDSTAYTPTTVSAGASASNSSASAVVTTQARSTVSAGSSPSTTTVLNNALFHNTTNPAANYLIETDPRFANMRSWLGSDYMLRSLALDPSVTQKRLGDGFYEQRLINEQVNNLTGRRFLGNYTSDEQQYQALMDAGVTYAQTQNLRPGIALTAAQVANLTSDIVWLVEKEVILKGGSKQKVLVPQVYAMVREGDLSNTGALLSGNTVSINASGDAKNNGTILGRKLVEISASNIQNTDGTVQGDNVSLSAAQDITNTRGTFAAQNSLQAVAGGDINMQTTTSTSGNDANGRTVLDRQARVYVGSNINGSKPGDMLLAAAGNINLGAAKIETTGDASLQAGGNVNMNAVTTGENVLFQGTGDAQYRQRIRNTDQTGSSINSQGNLAINAGANIVGTAAQVSAQGDVDMTAGQSVALLAGQKTRESDLSWTSKSFGDFTATVTNTRIQDSSATAQVSKVEGKNVNIVADKDLISVGTQFKGTDSLRVEGKDTSTFYAATDVQQSTTTVHSKTTVGPVLSNFLDPLGIGMPLEDKTTTDARASSVAIGTKLISNQKIEIGVGNKTELQGTEVDAPQIAFVKTDPSKTGELILGGSTNTTQTSHTEKTETLGLYQENKGQGSTTETLNQTKLKGNVNFDSALKITAQIPDTKGGQELKSQISALVAQGSGSGLDYLTTLANNPNVKWDKVALAHEKWSYDQAGLTGAGAALLTIVVAYFTAGTGTAALGTTTSVAGGAAGATVTTLGGVTLTSTAAGLTTAGIAINAGFSALASQAAVAMVNNKGDIGKTLEQLGSEQSIKNLVLTMVTAGALDKLNSTMGWQSVTAKSPFIDQFQKNLGNNLATDMLNSALAGKPFDEVSLQKSLAGALTTTGMAYEANSIGDGLKNGDLNVFTHKIAHAVLGCVGGATIAGNGSGCAPGAVGAVVGELTAEYATKSGMSHTNALALAKAVAAASGVITGGGGDNAAAVNIAASTGANAAENNYLNHAEATLRESLRDKVRKGEKLSNSEQKQLTDLEVLDIARDLMLQSACTKPSNNCDLARRDLNQAISTYLTTPGMWNARLSKEANNQIIAERTDAIALSNNPNLAPQSYKDAFNEFAGPQIAGYAVGGALGVYLNEARAIYAAIKAEGKVTSVASSDVAAFCAGNACFVAGTLIETSQGLKPIESFIGGELVLSRDEQTQELGFRPVRGTKQTHDQALYEVVVINPQSAIDTLHTTSEHPFWVKNLGWIKAAALSSEMVLLDRNGQELRVLSQLALNQTATVYNIEVQEHHTYHVGSLGVWVHNANCCDVASYGELKATAKVGDALEHDHIPSFAALKLAEETRLGRLLTPSEERTLYTTATAVEVPRDVHMQSPTYAGRNTKEQIASDAKDLCGAVCRDTNALRTNLLQKGYDSALVEQTILAIIERNKTLGITK